MASAEEAKDILTNNPQYLSTPDARMLQKISQNFSKETGFLL